MGWALGVVGSSCSSALRSMRIVVVGVGRSWSSCACRACGGAESARTDGKMVWGVGGVACSAGMGVGYRGGLSAGVGGDVTVVGDRRWRTGLTVWVWARGLGVGSSWGWVVSACSSIVEWGNAGWRVGRRGGMSRGFGRES
eukprot:4192473-Pyramimonas_sp.AAC.1